MAILTLSIWHYISVFTQKRDFKVVLESYNKYKSNIQFPVLLNRSNSLQKGIKCLASRAFYRFSSTRLINLINTNTQLRYSISSFTHRKDCCFRLSMSLANNDQLKVNYALINKNLLEALTPQMLVLLVDRINQINI